MKRTALKRKSTLKAKTGFKPPTKAMKQVSDKKMAKLKAEGKSVYSTLNQNSELKSSHQLKSNSTLSAKSKANKAGSRMNSMSGHGRSKTDIAFHDRIVKLGCSACIAEGRESIHPLQVHHPEGRNRGMIGDYKERFSLCLCAEHHDQRIYHGFHNGVSWVPVDKSIPSVHHAKASFYSRYGSEAYLVHEQYLQLQEKPSWLTDAEWKDYQSINSRHERDLWVQEAMKPANASMRRAIAGGLV